MHPTDPRWNALEARYEALCADRLTVEGCMRHEPHNGSRAAMVRPTNLPQVEMVNATEVRASERWTLDRPSTVKWPTKWDGQCYSISPDGHRVAFNPTSDETTTTRKVATTTDHAGDYARRTALVGISDQPA
jgi:hypothetical protein